MVVEEDRVHGYAGPAEPAADVRLHAGVEDIDVDFLVGYQVADNFHEDARHRRELPRP